MASDRDPSDGSDGEWAFAWPNRFRRLSNDHKNLAETLASLHVLCFCTLMLKAVGPWIEET